MASPPNLLLLHRRLLIISQDAGGDFGFYVSCGQTVSDHVLLEGLNAMPIEVPNLSVRVTAKDSLVRLLSSYQAVNAT